MMHFPSSIRFLPCDDGQKLKPGEGLITEIATDVLHLLQRTLLITPNGTHKVVQYGGSVVLDSRIKIIGKHKSFFMFLST